MDEEGKAKVSFINDENQRDIEKEFDELKENNKYDLAELKDQILDLSK